MSETQTENGASAIKGADPNPGMLWPVGARLVSATRSTLWLAPLLGGLMLLVHFWRVGYLPALSFSELGVVLGAFGLFVAMGLVAALLLVLFPVWSLQQWTSSSILPAPPKSRPDAVVRRRRSLSRRPLSVVELDASPAKRRTFSVRLAPGAFGMFWLASVTAAALTSIALFVLPPHLAKQWHVVPIATLLVAGFVIALGVDAWATLGVSDSSLRRVRRPVVQFLLLLSLYLCLWPAWLVLLASFDAWPSAFIDWFMLGFLSLFWAPWLHWMWYATLRKQGQLIKEIRVISIGGALLYAGLMQPLLDGAASTYGFGMMRKVDLVLSARGCAIVQEALPGQACEPLPAKGDDDRRVYRLRGVDVLTRIGADYVIAPAGGIDDRALPRLALPADEVHALVRSIEGKK